jgi:hypothetical protein
MFFVSAMIFAAATFHFSEELEDEELALAEQTAVIGQDDDAEDGELIFDKDEIVAELEDDS